jgi:hypothetical protein
MNSNRTRAKKATTHGICEIKPFDNYDKEITVFIGDVLININNDDVDHDEAAAITRLIAAAPDLYDACAEFVRKVECGEAKSTRSYRQMKDALAKARGETK